MRSLKLDNIGWSPNRSFWTFMAAVCLVGGGCQAWGLQECLREGRVGGAAVALLFLLVFLGTFVLCLVAIIRDHNLDEATEDLVRWWRKKGANIGKSVGRRMLYLLGVVACAAVDYLMWSVSKMPMEGDWWVTGRLLLGLFCVVVTIVPATLIGLGVLALAIFDPPLEELVMRGWPRPRKKEG